MALVKPKANMIRDREARVGTWPMSLSELQHCGVTILDGNCARGPGHIGFRSAVSDVGPTGEWNPSDPFPAHFRSSTQLP